MSSSESAGERVEQTLEGHIESGAAAVGPALYPDDCGELSLDTRRALVQLLSGPALEGRRHGKLWAVLVRDEHIVRSRLADMFLKLIVDRDAQVAFTQQADTAGLETPLLLRRSQLTFIDSILLLDLRRRLTASDARGERAVVSAGEIMEAMLVYERVNSTDRAGFNKRVHASIEKFKKRNILQKIRSTDDRFEISPALKLLFSADRIHALNAVYQSIAAGERTPIGISDSEDDQKQETDL